MLKQKLNTSEVRADQVANTKLQTLKLGLDVHADTIVVVRILDNSAPQPAQKFTPAKFLDWIKTQLPLAEQVHSCYEAGPFGYGLHRTLIALGVHNLVVQPVCLDEQHKGVNHDKSDAKQLALRLDRYVAGTRTPWLLSVCPRHRRNKNALKAASGNNSSGKSNAWRPRAAASCSPKGSAKRKAGGRTGAGRSSNSNFRPGWCYGWSVSAACWPP